VWLKAENYNAATGTWTDAGALGFSPSQATEANRPTLTSNAFKTYPAVTYSATQNLTGTSMPLANSRTKGTWMAVFRSDTGSPPGGSVFSTTQDQLGLLSDGRVALNTAAAEYGTMAAGAKAGMLSLAGGQVSTLIYDGALAGNANRLKFRRNLIQETLTFTGTIPATTYAGGTGVFLGREANGSGWAHNAAEIIFWRAVALTDPQIAEWESYLAAKYLTKTTKQMVVSGDSNAKGSPNHVDAGWPQRVTAALGWAAVSNNSTVGYKLIQGSASPNFEKRDDWHTAQPYVVALGTNDLAVDHASLATLQGYVNTLKTKLTACRYPIFAFTIPAAGANIAGADETTRTGFNAWLAAQTGLTVIDVAAALGDPTGAGGANFEGDDLHLSDAGHEVVEAAVVAAFTTAGYV
jgi:hypothetical protein